MLDCLYLGDCAVGLLMPQFLRLASNLAYSRSACALASDITTVPPFRSTTLPRLFNWLSRSELASDMSFTAELASRKAALFVDPVPRTSPSCRAAFCGPGCNLSPVAFTHEAAVTAIDTETNAVTLSTAVALESLAGGWLRWIDGPHAGLIMTVMLADAAGLVLDTPLDPDLAPGLRALVREGCDHTLDTCATRFANAVNFQGEPFLPGNDLLTRYPAPVQ